MSGRNVVVVGAGFAGLAAADALAASGHEVTVFEARDRVGGRVHSRTLDDGATIELGAEFILPGHDVLRATAERLRLPLYEKGTRYGDREPRPPVRREELLRAIARLRDAREGTVASALEGLRLPPAVRDALTARVEISTAYPASDQAASVLADSGTAFGDYAAGSNHVLPTGGTGRFSGPLGPAVFRRRIANVSLPGSAAEALAPDVETLARAEGLPVHGESARARG